MSGNPVAEGYAELVTIGYRAGLEAAAGVLREWAGHYPSDIWPDDGANADCRMAKFARHLCREIEKDVHALAAPPPEPPLDGTDASGAGDGARRR